MARSPAIPIGSGLRPVIEMTIHLPFPIDVPTSLAALWRGPGDPSLRFDGRTVARAARLVSGPATVELTARSERDIDIRAWGVGAEEAVASVPELLGAMDDPSALVPRHRLIAELARRRPGLRMIRTRAVFEALVPAIIGQKVTGFESSHSYRALVRRFGETAPGPLGLLLPPAAEMLAREPYWRLHELGIERRRADVVRGAAAVAARLEAPVHLSDAVPLPAASAELTRRLVSLPGIGPWTAAETVRVALGDPDAVSVGDYNIPSLVSWALAGEPRADDARMLELLAPYAGQRARVVMLLEGAGIRVPRYGPRMAARSIVAI